MYFLAVFKNYGDGIGLDFKITNDRLRVAGVIEGSPAYSIEVFQPWGQTKCTPPIKKGDYVKEIDGNDVSKLSPAEGSIFLRGQPGTTVKVKLERRGASTCRYEIKLERSVKIILGVLAVGVLMHALLMTGQGLFSKAEAYSDEVYRVTLCDQHGYKCNNGQ